MKRLIAAAAILAVVFVVGCQDTKKLTMVQGQLDKANQQITDLTGQVAKVTADRDSLAKMLMDLQAKTGGKGGKSTGGKTPGTPPGKPPRVGH